MTKKELRQIIDQEIMWSLKFAIDEIESDNHYDWYIKQHCDKIQGMLLVAQSANILNHKEWQTCMAMINHFAYCYDNSKIPNISYKY